MINQQELALAGSDSAVVPNPDLAALCCLRCDKLYELSDPQVDSGLGCAACMEQGYPTGLHCVYHREPSLSINTEQTGMLKFSQMLPFLAFPSLGEGGTPLVPLKALSKEYGVENIWVKNEGQNPTGSHKDRMSPVAVARAVSAGYSKVIASSSGNAGASLASYAARAGVSCRIIAGEDISSAWASAIKATGAELQLVESEQRWPLMQKLVQQDQWFPVTNFWKTPVGSNPFGLEGYKTIAHEIVEQLRTPPTVVIVPTCRGDMLFGIWRGFFEALQCGVIAEIPRLVAVEPGRRLELVMEGCDYRSVFDVPPNVMTSIDGGTATYQSYKALKSSNGAAVSVTSNDTRQAQRVLAMQGFYVEASSAASLAALSKLHDAGSVSAKDRVVLIATSHGYKEPFDLSLPEVTRPCN